MGGLGRVWVENGPTLLTHVTHFDPYSCCANLMTHIQPDTYPTVLDPTSWRRAARSRRTLAPRSDPHHVPALINSVYFPSWCVLKTPLKDISLGLSLLLIPFSFYTYLALHNHKDILGICLGKVL